MLIDDAHDEHYPVPDHGWRYFVPDLGYRHVRQKCVYAPHQYH